MSPLPWSEPTITSFFDPEQRWLEPAVRGRAARRARALVRRAMPVAMTTPRWSDPGRFLDDLSLDLAVGEPPVGCRRVSFRHLRGADAATSRLEVLRVLTRMVRPRSLLPPPMVADRRGFRHAVQELALEAEGLARHAVGLLFSETDHLPFEVGEDLVEAWTDLTLARGPDLRITLLLAGSQVSAWHGPFVPLDLADFGEHEAAAELTRQVGPLHPALLHNASVLSGGVPALLDDFAAVSARGGLEVVPLLSCRGVLDEVRGAIDIAGMEPKLGGRLAALAEEGVLDREDEDDRLVRAGLVRIRRDGRSAELRAPAFAHLI